MIEEATDDFWAAYLRLLHDYEQLKARYAHARAAIDNDIWLADEQERRKALEF